MGEELKSENKNKKTKTDSPAPYFHLVVGILFFTNYCRRDKQRKYSGKGFLKREHSNIQDVYKQNSSFRPLSKQLVLHTSMYVCQTIKLQGKHNSSNNQLIYDFTIAANIRLRFAAKKGVDINFFFFWITNVHLEKMLTKLSIKSEFYLCNSKGRQTYWIEIQDRLPIHQVEVQKWIAVI